MVYSAILQRSYPPLTSAHVPRVVPLVLDRHNLPQDDKNRLCHKVITVQGKFLGNEKKVENGRISPFFGQ